MGIDYNLEICCEIKINTKNKFKLPHGHLQIATPKFHQWKFQILIFYLKHPLLLSILRHIIIK